MAGNWPSDTDPRPTDKLDQDTDDVTGTGNARDQLLTVSQTLNEILAAAAANSQLVTTTDRFNSALTNIANLFTENQTISKDSPRLKLNDTSGPDLTASVDFEYNGNIYSRIQRNAGGANYLEIDCRDESAGFVDASRIRLFRDGSVTIMFDGGNHELVFRTNGNLELDGVPLITEATVPAGLVATGRQEGVGGSQGSPGNNNWIAVASIPNVSIGSNQKLTCTGRVNAYYTNDFTGTFWNGCRFQHNGVTFGRMENPAGHHLFAESDRTVAATGTLLFEIETSVNQPVTWGDGLLTYRVESN